MAEPAYPRRVSTIVCARHAIPRATRPTKFSGPNRYFESPHANSAIVMTSNTGNEIHAVGSAEGQILVVALQILNAFAYIYELPRCFYLIPKVPGNNSSVRSEYRQIIPTPANTSCVTGYPTSLSWLVPEIPANFSGPCLGAYPLKLVVGSCPLIIAGTPLTLAGSVVGPTR